jgi:hypothetical protein
VTCLQVASNIATAGVAITLSNDPTRPVGSGLFVVLQDNGPPLNGQWANRVNISGVSLPPTACSPAAAPSTLFIGPAQVASGG